jgi:hypothetical protein
VARSLANLQGEFCVAALYRFWFGGSSEGTDRLFEPGFDPETAPIGWLTDPMVAPSGDFRVTGRHEEFLWRLLPPELELRATELSGAALLVANKFLEALGATSGPSDSRHLGTAVAAHSLGLDILRNKDPETYGLLIQARFGDVIDRLPQVELDSRLLRLVRNHAMFMAMHAAKIIGMLSGASRRNPMPSVVDTASSAIKVGAGMRALKEKAASISNLLDGVPADLSGTYHKDRTIYDNGLVVAGIDVMPFARRMEQHYRNLPPMSRKRFRKELGCIVAQCDRQTNQFIGRINQEGGSGPIKVLFPQDKLAGYRPAIANKDHNGHTELLKLWTGFSPTLAVAAAGVSLAIALHDIPALIEQRRRNGSHEERCPPRSAWPKRLPYGSTELAFSICEVLRAGFTRDKDVGVKLAASVIKDEFPVRSHDAGRTLIKQILAMLGDPNKPDPFPVTVQPQRWFREGVEPDQA